MAAARLRAEWRSRGPRTAQADFDDSGWGRYSAELFTLCGGYGYRQSAASTLLCLRTRFGIADPAQVRDLALTLDYRGGVVVYVNGRELARQHLPQDALEPQTPAEAYPPEAFTGPDGTVLPSSDRPAKEHGNAYEGRIRRLSVLLPADTLRRGANTLAIELHRAPTGSMPLRGKTTWATLGLCDVKLLSCLTAIQALPRHAPPRGRHSVPGPRSQYALPLPSR